MISTLGDFKQQSGGPALRLDELDCLLVEGGKHLGAQPGALEGTKYGQYRHFCAKGILAQRKAFGDGSPGRTRTSDPAVNRRFPGAFMRRQATPHHT
jgi:hypothetical protein